MFHPRAQEISAASWVYPYRKLDHGIIDDATTHYYEFHKADISESRMNEVVGNPHFQN